jgi:hypothetical protein
MALLRSPLREVQLPCRCLVGRSTLADLRLSSRRGSSEHASLGWYAGRWVLRDLGSSNGTRLNDKPLFPGDRVSLSSGNLIHFGGENEVFTLVDDEPPDPCAVLLGPQLYAWGSKTLLVLPGPDSPEASVFLDEDGWRLDAGTDLRKVECGEIVSLSSGFWRVLVPENVGSPAARTAGPELDLAELLLRFSVAPERTSVTLEQGSTSVSLPSRACLNTLVALARARLEASGPEARRGWVSSLDLADSLRYTPEKVNVDVHRLRKMFQEAGVRNAPQIIERDDSKQLRIGVRRLVEGAGR